MSTELIIEMRTSEEFNNLLWEGIKMRLTADGILEQVIEQVHNITRHLCENQCKDHVIKGKYGITYRYRGSNCGLYFASDIHNPMLDEPSTQVEIHFLANRDKLSKEEKSRQTKETGQYCRGSPRNHLSDWEHKEKRPLWLCVQYQLNISAILDGTFRLNLPETIEEVLKHGR